MSNCWSQIDVIKSAYLLREGCVADDRVIALLQEIRDLQKLHIQNYQDALKNQQESIAIQRGAIRRQKTVLLVLFVLLAAFASLVFLSVRH